MMDTKEKTRQNMNAMHAPRRWEKIRRRKKKTNIASKESLWIRFGFKARNSMKRVLWYTFHWTHWCVVIEIWVISHIYCRYDSGRVKFSVAMLIRIELLYRDDIQSLEINPFAELEMYLWHMVQSMNSTCVMWFESGNVSHWILNSFIDSNRYSWSMARTIF